jgi:hypothetical protein
MEPFWSQRVCTFKRALRIEFEESICELAALRLPRQVFELPSARTAEVLAACAPGIWTGRMSSWIEFGLCPTAACTLWVIPRTRRSRALYFPQLEPILETVKVEFAAPQRRTAALRRLCAIVYDAIYLDPAHFDRGKSVRARADAGSAHRGGFRDNLTFGEVMAECVHRPEISESPVIMRVRRSSATPTSSPKFIDCCSHPIPSPQSSRMRASAFAISPRFTGLSQLLSP